jgi:peptide/nickel transport system permease protein
MAESTTSNAEKLSGAARYREAERKKGLSRTIGQFIRAKPLGAFGAAILILLLVAALTADFVAPYGFAQTDVPNRLSSPSSDHYFGTDEQGRDVFSRILYGAQTSVIIAFIAITTMTLIATTLGIASGYFGGWFDLMFQRVIDIWLALPGLIFIIFVASLFGSNTVFLALVIGLLMAGGSSRLIRSATISIRESLYVESARAAGASSFRIITKHLLPNVAAVIIISASVQIGSVILLESSLSFLGFGPPPPMPSWGRMLREAQLYMHRDWYLAVFPGLAITATVFGMNMFGDALRDVLDPRLRRGR